MNSQCQAAGSRPTMQALAQPHGTCSRTPARSRRTTRAFSGYLAPQQLHGSQCISQQQLQAAAVSILSAESRATATYADSWMPPARRTPRGTTDPVRPRQQQQPTWQQESSSSTSSSNVTRPSPPAAQTQAAYQPLAYATSAYDAPRRSTPGQTSSQSPQETLSSAVDKICKQRLREAKAMLGPESLQQLQQELSPEELQTLQFVIHDLENLQGSWEEEDEQLNVSEQQLVHQVTSAAQIMPDDFHSYLLGMLPPGSDQGDLQQLLFMMDEDLLQDLQSVYHELKEFEQADLGLSVAQDRYIELSGRISTVSARIQDAMAEQQQQQQQQQQSGQATQSSSRRRSVDVQQPEQHLQTVEPTATAAQQSSSSSNGSSSSSSSRKWGSTWAKPRRAADRKTETTQQQQQQQQQLDQQGGQLPGVDAPVQQQKEEHLLAAATAAAGQQQQQQQSGVRQRRRRIIRRDATD